MSNPLPDTFRYRTDRSHKTSTTLKDQGTGHKFTTGYVKTLHGIVGFYMQHPYESKDYKERGWLIMEIAHEHEHDGIFHYSRQWNDRAFTDIGIVRLANKFMDDVRFGLAVTHTQETTARYKAKKKGAR